MAHIVVLAALAFLASSASGQTLDCQTSATMGGNAQGRGCVFPFDYFGTEYTECTNADYGSSFWCSVTADYSEDRMWGECICSVVNSNTPAPQPGSGCTESTRSGTMCAQTFLYQGKTYSGCPTLDNQGTPWCSLTDDYDVDGRWENCAVPLKCETPQSGTGCRENTVFGSSCASSFIYNKVTYNGCTTVDNGGQPWCSLTDNYDADNQFGNCKVPLQCVTSGGAGPGCKEKTYFGGECASKFIYNGQEFIGCTTINNAGTPWCSLTDSFDRDNQWADCQSPLQCSTTPDGEGCFERTRGGGFCAQKYVYNGNNYVGCTKVDYGNVPWCSLTENYDLDRQFDECQTPLMCTTGASP